MNFFYILVTFNVAKMYDDLVGSGGQKEYILKDHIRKTIAEYLGLSTNEVWGTEIHPGKW